MQVPLWPIAKFKPSSNNPRVNDDGVHAVAVSIREFGFRQPIVVDSEGVIVCGHTRYKAALRDRPALRTVHWEDGGAGNRLCNLCGPTLECESISSRKPGSPSNKADEYGSVRQAH